MRLLEWDNEQSSFASLLCPCKRHAVDLIVPPDWIDNAVDDGIDNVFNFLEEGRTDDYVLGYRAFLEIFRSDARREGMTIIIKQYPPCPASYSPIFEYKERNVEIECLPLDVPVSQVADQVYTTLISGLNSDPTVLASDGAARLKWPPEIVSEAEPIRNAFQVLQQLWLFWLIPLGLLIVIALLAVRSLYSMGIWFGIPLLITGVITPIVGLIIFVQIFDLLQYVLGGLGPSEDRLIQLLILFVTEIAYSLPSIWLFIVLFQAGIMFLLGGGGLVLALLLKLLTQGALVNRLGRRTKPNKAEVATL